MLQRKYKTNTVNSRIWTLKHRIFKNYVKKQAKRIKKYVSAFSVEWSMILHIKYVIKITLWKEISKKNLNIFAKEAQMPISSWIESLEKMFNFEKPN